MKRIIAGAVVLVLATGSVAQAQEQAKASGNASAAGITASLNFVKGNVLKAAERVPEDQYSFQPTPEVRTLGAILAHIADANNYICSLIAGQQAEYSDATETTAKTKTEIVAALNASFEKCDAAYGAVTDADLARPVTMFGSQANVAGAMAFNAAHDWEHYGNIVTYMRMLKMVPPSSQQ